MFGGLIILPLYFELLRHQGTVDTGLLLLAYGSGAVLAMRAGGRLTDRLGGGITASAGLTITVATTLPLAFLSAHAALAGVEALQFLRGTGIGLAGVPAMSAAYATVARDKRPRRHRPGEHPPAGRRLPRQRPFRRRPGKLRQPRRRLPRRLRLAHRHIRRRPSRRGMAHHRTTSRPPPALTAASRRKTGKREVTIRYPACRRSCVSCAA